MVIFHVSSSENSIVQHVLQIENNIMINFNVSVIIIACAQ